MKYTIRVINKTRTSTSFYFFIPDKVTVLPLNVINSIVLIVCLIHNTHTLRNDTLVGIY